MARKTLRWLVLVGVVLAGGCQWDHIAMPQWRDPGTERDKQKRDRQFDPYPTTAVGPAIPGLRPREFDVPSAGPHRRKYDY